MTDNVLYPEIKWQNRMIIESRRQRRTGKTIIRAWRITDRGESYIDYHDPVRLSEFLLTAMKSGYRVEWKRRSTSTREDTGLLSLRREWRRATKQDRATFLEWVSGGLGRTRGSI